MPRRMRHATPHAVALAAIGACLPAGPAWAQSSAPPSPPAVSAPAPSASAPAASAPKAALPTVEVIGITPVPGTGVPKDQIPSNVQTANDLRLRRLQSLNLPEFMATELPSVNVNQTQGNPYGMDVNYRGFTASPLLGTPQGISVFQDGVRVNEPFGDVVNWDLIPQAALASVTLLPGSNPLFGLNTLGGALSLQTKSGDTHPGTEIELQGGSWGRVSAEFTHGQKLGETGHLFLAATGLDEDGWRDASPSRIRQLFAKVGQRTADGSWELSATGAHNNLIGNGLLPESMLAQRRSQVYTTPDQTLNDLTLVTFNGTLKLNEQQALSATVYGRDSNAKTVNGDLNDDYDPPDDTEAGIDHYTSTTQHGSGAALQWAYTDARHRLAVGASIDRAGNAFTQTSATGQLDASRATVVTDPAVVDVQITGSSRTESLFFSDVFSALPNLQLSVSGRYNDTHVSTFDVGRATLGLDTQLDSDATYKKFNPAAGLTWQVTPMLTAYSGWSQGNRAPSPIESGCSDPTQACVLPNALQSDPPLKQVVSRTWEAGLRGQLAGSLRWNASLFSTSNQDDLLFVSNGLAAGYFKNVGRTLRRGLELGLSQRKGALGWSASYSFLRATYDASACLVSASNSSAGSSPACTGDSEIAVVPGDRIPGLPAHTLKLNADWQATPAWNIGAQFSAFSSQYVRGNENNAQQPDGVNFNGRGQLPGYALLNLTTEWKVGGGWEIFGKVTNVFDRDFATGGLLSVNSFTPTGVLLPPANWRNELFVAPSAPRAAWVGVRLKFGGDEV